jgi:hypothetical protein
MRHSQSVRLVEEIGRGRHGVQCATVTGHARAKRGAEHCERA